MKKNINVNVEYITRVEGHGNIVINVDIKQNMPSGHC
jgi:coenzyme F420-reducing hydrogenase alpha subunit